MPNMDVAEQAVGEIERLGEALESKVTVGGNEAGGGGCGHGSEDDDGEDKKVLDALEDFFSAPEFTGYVRKFVEENVGNFVFVEDGEEQPLCNYDLYMKYTKIIEEQLDDFLKKHGVTHEDVAALCAQEKDGSSNSHHYCLDYIIASTQYDSFLGMMMELHDMREYMFDGEEFAGYSCLGDLGEPLEGLEGIDESPEADGEVPKP